MRVFPCCVREPSLHLVGVCVWDADESIHPCILLYVQLHI